MRVLITIPHYYDPDGGGRHGSLASNARARIEALTACVTSLQRTLGSPHHMLNIERRLAEEANYSEPHSLKIVICTTRSRHIVNELEVEPGCFTHLETKAEPKLLGFECHRVLSESLGQFDYYGFMEDDLILRDPWFFRKLSWFNEIVGSSALLQPNRYETALQGPSLKAYVDGNIRPELTQAFQDRSENPQLFGKVMGKRVRFVRPANPHSGCFFLTVEQMGHWTAQPYFLDRDTSFIGPLESAATLGVTRTFRVYKPAPEAADFLEIQHAGMGFIGLVGNSIPLAPRHKNRDSDSETAANANAQELSRSRESSAPYRFGWDPFQDIKKLSDIWHYSIEVFFDVGANDGQTMLRAVQAFPKCRIVAFEPHSEPLLLLKQRSASNPNVEVVNLALGSEEGEKTMFQYEDSHLNSLAPNAQFAVRFDKIANRIAVECTTLDHFCVERRIDKIDVLKIDTEGFDHEVLKGARAVLDRRSIKFIYFEFNSIEFKPGTTGGALAPIDRFLQKYGYQFIASYNDYVVATGGDPFVVANALYALPPPKPPKR
jgi:FkbM family methyltransferase